MTSRGGVAVSDTRYFVAAAHRALDSVYRVSPTMKTLEEILRSCSQNGELDKKEWPQVREAILKRLDEIVHNEFPLPSLPPQQLPEAPIIQSNAPPATQTTESSSQVSSSTEAANKENAPPSSPPQMTVPPVPAFNAHPSSQNTPLTNGALPPSVLPNYNFIKRALQTQFIAFPPHTIQRLAELILRPTQHYRFLPAYLNALDRVLSVSSGTDRFARENASESSNLLNGNMNSASALGSDESLGGALLTPIPWLRQDQSQLSDPDDQDQMADESIPLTTNESLIAGLREEGGVTQGELLRHEQESGSVSIPLDASRLTTLDGEKEEAEMGERPHVTGPDEVGVEDLGPQQPMGAGQKLDMEAAVGRPAQSQRKSENTIEDGTIPPKNADAAQPTLATEVSDHHGDVEVGGAEDAITKNLDSKDDTRSESVNASD